MTTTDRQQVRRPADRGTPPPALGLLVGIILICGAAFITLDTLAAWAGAPPKARTVIVWAGCNVAAWTWLALAHGESKQ